MDSEPTTPAPGPAKPDKPDTPIDINSILLPKKEGGASVDSAERVQAGALLSQEQAAAAPRAQTSPIAPKPEPLQPLPIGDVSAPAVPAAPKKEETSVRAVQTYGTDINRVLQSGTVSITSMAAAEAERRASAVAGEPVAPVAPEQPKDSPMRLVLIIAGTLLLVSTLGIAAAIVLRPGGPVQPAPQVPAPFVAVDQTVTIPMPPGSTRASLMPALDAAKQGVTLSLGLVARLQVVVPGTAPTTASAQQFLGTLAPDIPEPLLRTIEPVYLLGVHSYDENQPFLILRVDTYQQAFSGLLDWEDTMERDLTPLFSRRPPVRLETSAPTGSTTAATSTSSSTAPATPLQVIRTKFVDRVVQNHDARVLQDRNGDILLLWTFIDRDTVAIATNEFTLAEILSRLTIASLIPQP